MHQRDRSYLIDILIAARLIREFVAGMDSDGFQLDLKTQSAVMRQLEVMGEAAKQVSGDFRTGHPQIPWRKIAGMRDVLIHGYRGVRPADVWNAATISVPALISDLEPLLPEAEDESDEGSGRDDT